MTVQSFCTKCGSARAADARFCTVCGASITGAASSPSSTRAGTSQAKAPATAIAMGALLLALGGVAAYFALREPAEVQRAVAGSPGGPPGAPTAEGGLPTGHPSIELPKEITDFLDGLSAEADKDPKSVDAAQKLLRARYRASVINASYRASAQQALDKLLALDPTNDEGMRISANLAYDAGDYPEAQRRFEAFLAKNPDDAGAITDLGSAQLFQDQVDEAVKSYQRAVAKDATFMQAHFNLGIALQKQGKKEEAIASLRSALSLADSPETRQHIENALAEVEGREPMPIAGAPSAARKGSAAPGGPPAGGPPGNAPGAAPGGMQGGMQGGMPMPPPAPERDVPTNAGSDFQQQVQKPFITHPMIGPRVVAFEWSGPTALRAKLADFPMDQMPPFARAKFKSGMAEKLAALAKQNGVAGTVTVEIVDNASGRVMETLDTSAPAAAGAAPAAPGAPPR